MPINFPRPFVFLLALGWFAVLAPASPAAETLIKPGEKLASLTVGPVTYVQVQVRSYNARTLMITHAGGMASIHLRDLSPEWQARFNYDPAAETADQAKPVPAPLKHIARPVTPTPMEHLLQQFGTPATAQSEVNLRPKFAELELKVKNQGRRPSCSIFAIVSALEYQNALLTGHADKFSEEYLIWATRRTLQRPTAAANGDEVERDDADEGFSLNEVVSALRTYGIPLQASMPYHYGKKNGPLEEPPATVIAEAQSHHRVSVFNLPGRDPATRLNNLVQCLNAGVPVTVGLAWPNFRTLRSGFLSKQKPVPGSGHAVTLVGYQSATERIEDAVFIFKNSWGVDWGEGGYGRVTYGYLSNYLNEAVLLEVERG